MAGPLGINEDVLHAFMFYAGVILLKMIVMSPIVGLTRVIKKAFVNPEDAALVNLKPMKNHETVERIRRAHLNDIENIVPFFCVGLLYAMSRPAPDVAINCFRIFTAARIGHTLSYFGGLFVPRFLCFGAAIAVNFYMVVNVILAHM